MEQGSACRRNGTKSIKENETGTTKSTTCSQIYSQVIGAQSRIETSMQHYLSGSKLLILDQISKFSSRGKDKFDLTTYTKSLCKLSMLVLLLHTLSNHTPPPPTLPPGRTNHSTRENHLKHRELNKSSRRNWSQRQLSGFDHLHD